MSIKAVFRVQCDGPGKEWLSLPENYTPGTDVLRADLVAEPTAARAALYPGEGAARRAARGSGWVSGELWGLLCPTCAVNPLGIVLPPNERPDRCEATVPSGRIRCTRYLGHTDEHRNGTVDWF